MKYDERMKSRVERYETSRNNMVIGFAKGKEKIEYEFKEKSRSPISDALFITETYMIVESSINQSQFDSAS